MSVIEFARIDHESTPTAPELEIVIPVYNEAEQLAASVTVLRSYLDSSFPLLTTVTIADNASTDGTGRIADELASTLPGVRTIHLDRKGRGRALRAAWTGATAPVVSYMDVDLATGLDALFPLVAPLVSGHSDLSIGTRLAPGAHVVRGAKREIISRSYNLLVRSVLASACTDAQCGFKAMRREAAAELLPLVEDDEWFFDTELLVTAQRLGLRIHEVPVDWVDDTDSRVEVLRTALMDLRGVVRMLGRRARGRVVRRTNPVPPAPRPHTRTGPAAGDSREHRVFADDLVRFAGVGATSTVAYVVLFAALAPALGVFVANAVAIGICSLGNTATHRGMAGTARHGLGRWQRSGTAAALLAVSLAFTTAALAATRATGLTSLVPQVCAVALANVAAAVVRFGILRTWVFRPAFGSHLATTGAAATTDGYYQLDEMRESS
ncbi:MAG TPA: dolichyl-phosphate beta-glucosyltransferase [Acidimicrobiales bacterium]|nr:dolichyl-phosphate beta-glucosyltransferase [Acidimicrobiales bacterium]